LLMKKIRTHNVKCWLLNTGWSGEPYGEAERIKIAYSRALIKSLLNGTLDQGQFEKDPLFGFMIPKACEGVPSEILDPRNSTSDKAVYEERAKKLAADFKDNFKQFENDVSEEVLDAMP
ncbi:MAG: phosphoenolpyruvate carboxykinase (ATP), partial [Deltaproteobacteria bacterium]|nr:phosphoenolpyruvate carboxykinase (ATP) [Deltaproteobacteria bacterium]